MNTRLVVLLLVSEASLFTTPIAATAEVAAPLERGLHHTVWQWATPEGETNQFTELCSGLNRWSDTDKSWVPANEVIEEVNGVLIARQTAHQVIFANGADVPERTIDLLMTDGRRLRIRPAGLAYTEVEDGQPGKSVFIAELKSSQSELTAPNQVTYFDALDGADVQYDLSLAGLEQNHAFLCRLRK